MNGSMNIYDVIKGETEQHLQQAALIEGGRRLSYGELFQATERLAETLRRTGVGRLHRVALLCDDSIEFVIASLAILSLSAVAVPVSPEQVAADIDAIVERMDVEFILSEPRLRREPGQVRLTGDGLLARELVIVTRDARERPPAGFLSANPAIISAASGATRMGMGILLSHRTIVERMDAVDRGLCITHRDRVLWALSLDYHAMVPVLLFLRRGATIVLCGRPFPGALIQGLSLHRGTFICASPSHYSLLSRSDRVPCNALDRVRLALSASMTLPGQVGEEFLNRFGFELSEAYDLIEVGLPFVRLSGGAYTRGSVGRALPDYGLRLDNRDSDGIGEICVRGKGMLDASYAPWRIRDRILDEGWFRTGDLGRVDGDGFLFIVGRHRGCDQPGQLAEPCPERR